MKTTYFAATAIFALLSASLAGCGAGGEIDEIDEPTLDPAPELSLEEAPLEEATEDVGGEPEKRGPSAESICGGADDLQFVNNFGGKHGITKRFVQREKIPVGIYVVPTGNGGSSQCTGTLIAHDLFLTNSHCIPGDVSLPQSGQVSFGFEKDGPEAERLPQQAFGIASVVENGNDGLDYAIVRLNGNPGLVYGHQTVADYEPEGDSVIAIIQHPDGRSKQVDVGHVDSNIFSDDMFYDDLDTLGGSSGSGILDPNGELVGLHYSGGCGSWFSSNHGEKMTDLIDVSPTLASAPRHIIVSEPGDPSIYIVNGGARMGIGSMEEYDALGLRHQDHRVLTAGAVLSLPTAPRDGTVIRTVDGGIHMVFGGARFGIPSMEEFNDLGLTPADVHPAPYGATMALPLVPRHDTLLQERSSDGIFVVRWGYLYWIPTWEVFDAYGYTTNRVRIVPNGTLSQIPYGGTLS